VLEDATVEIGQLPLQLLHVGLLLRLPLVIYSGRGGGGADLALATVGGGSCLACRRHGRRASERAGR
jgi:hypothetical protein